jgi:hypothetical protein
MSLKLDSDLAVHCSKVNTQEERVGGKMKELLSSVFYFRKFKGTEAFHRVGKEEQESSDQEGYVLSVVFYI